MDANFRDIKTCFYENRVFQEQYKAPLICLNDAYFSQREYVNGVVKQVILKVLEKVQEKVYGVVNSLILYWSLGSISH